MLSVCFAFLVHICALGEPLNEEPHDAGYPLRQPHMLLSAPVRSLHSSHQVELFSWFWLSRLFRRDLLSGGSLGQGAAKQHQRRQISRVSYCMRPGIARTLMSLGACSVLRQPVPLRLMVRWSQSSHRDQRMGPKRAKVNLLHVSWPSGHRANPALGELFVDWEHACERSPAGL